jgi:hypothetical protein
MTTKKELQEFSSDEIMRMTGHLVEATIKFLEDANISAGSAAYYNLYSAFQRALKDEWAISKKREREAEEEMENE